MRTLQFMSKEKQREKAQETLDIYAPLATRLGIFKIKIELEKLGYKVETNLGNADYKISLAIYDKNLDRYLVGVECDYTAYKSSESLLERDVYRPTFLKTRGWDILRVWSRDWWLNKNKVISNITKIAEKNKAKLLAQHEQEQQKKPRTRTIKIKQKA